MLTAICQIYSIENCCIFKQRSGLTIKLKKKKNMNFGTHNDGGTNGGVSQLRNKLDGKTTYLLGGHAS